MERPDWSTLRLLHGIVEEVGTNEAIMAGGTLFSMTLELAPTQRWTVVEPPPKVLRHLLDLLRHLDMPSSDVRLERVYPILDRVCVRSDWEGFVADARQTYARAQTKRLHNVQDPDEGYVPDESKHTWIKPREAFGL